MTNPITYFWKRSQPLTRGLFFFVLGNCLAAPFTMHMLFSEPFPGIGLDATIRFVRLERPFLDDSWKPMNAAIVHVKSRPEQPLYQKIFFEDKTKFQYPPTSLLVLYPFGPMDLDQRHRGLIRFLSITSWLAATATMLFAVLIFQEVRRHSAPGRCAAPSAGNRWTQAIFTFILGLTFDPIIRAYDLGQIQAWMNACFAMAVWAWLKDRKKLSGALVGLMCLVKPQYGVLLLWGLIRKQKNFVVTGAATGLIGLVVSLWVFGLANHLDYLNVLSFMSRHGECYFPNQSVNGLLNRLLHNGQNLEFEMNAFAPYHPWVYYSTLISSVLLLAAALWWPARGREKGSAVDFSLMALAGTMASPIAWEHHYGILLPIYALLLPRLLQNKGERALLATCLTLSYMLSSHFLISVNRLADSHFNFVQSYLWIGALLALGILFRLRSQAVPKTQVVPKLIEAVDFATPTRGGRLQAAWARTLTIGKTWTIAGRPRQHLSPIEASQESKCPINNRPAQT